MGIKLTITFLDSTTDESVYNIYQKKYYGHGSELGSIGITSEGKIKTIIILPYQKKEGEEIENLNINDFTTYLVLKFKVAEIKTEKEPESEEKDTEPKTAEAKAEENAKINTETKAESTAEAEAEVECDACKIE